MHEPHDTTPWTPQRTRALFRLFQTSAPPDFQRQILARLAQRQPAQQRRRMGWRALLAWGLGSRAWRRGIRPAPSQTARPCPRHGRVLWPRARDQSRLVGGAAGSSGATHASAAAVAGRLAASALRRAHRGASPAATTTEAFGSAEPLEEAEQTAGPPTSSTSAPQMPMGQSVDKRTAFQAGNDPARTLLVPARGSQLTAQKERQLPAHRYTQRSGRPRGAPGKSSRSHTRGGDESAGTRLTARTAHAPTEERPMSAPHPLAQALPATCLLHRWRTRPHRPGAGARDAGLGPGR